MNGCGGRYPASAGAVLISRSGKRSGKNMTVLSENIQEETIMNIMDKLYARISELKNPTVAGLDTRIEYLP